MTDQGGGVEGQEAGREREGMRGFTGAFGQQHRTVCDGCHRTHWTTLRPPFLCWECERQRVMRAPSDA